jgi:hypothetical protein
VKRVRSASKAPSTRRHLRLGALFAAGAVGACAKSAQTSHTSERSSMAAVAEGLYDPAKALPQNFADTHLFGGPDFSAPNPRTFAYDVRDPLWSDDAQKRRFVYVPPDKKIGFDAAKGTFTFPVGTVFLKHFEVRDASPKRPYETRMLALKADGAWYFTNYKWGEDGAAVKTTEMAIVPGPAADTSYRIPSLEECRDCHLASKNSVLGFRPDQLNFDDGTGNQLEKLAKAGVFEAPVETLTAIPALADVADPSQPVEARARAYLDVNCSTCHNDQGIASILDLTLGKTLEETKLLAEGVIVPGNAEQSLLWKKISVPMSVDDLRMPPVALYPDPLAVDLLKQWIDQLPPELATAPADPKTPTKTPAEKPPKVKTEAQTETGTTVQTATGTSTATDTAPGSSTGTDDGADDGDAGASDAG